MNYTYKYSVLCLSLLVANGCKTTGGPDSTPPGFLSAAVKLVTPTNPNPQGEIEFKDADVERTNLGKETAIRVLVTAGDSESGIKSIHVIGQLQWRCAFGQGSQIIGVFETQPLNFTAINQPSAPQSLWQIDTTASPVVQTGCAMNKVGQGPVDLEGFIVVEIKNGSGMATKSKTFSFKYTDIGVRQ